MPPATPVSAGDVLTAFRAVEVTHVVTVPDTNLRTVLAVIDAEPGLTVVRAATEDDVLGISTGLWLAGRRPVALMQQLGLFASANSLRAFTHDQPVPLPILAGLYGRDVARAVDDQPSAAVRLCLPLLDALGIRWRLVEGPADAGQIKAGLAEAYTSHSPSVVLLGAPTT